MYKSLTQAFLYQTIVGFLSVIAISAIGGKGIFILALIGLRPFILQREKSSPQKKLWEMYYKIGKLSVVLTSLMIIATYLLAGIIFDVIIINNDWFIVIIPFWVMTHGVIGIVHAGKK